MKRRALRNLAYKSFDGLEFTFGNPLEVRLSFSVPDADINDVLAMIEVFLPRLPGRPALKNKQEILDAAAKAKASGGKVAWVASKFGKTPKQVHDLVRLNRPRFDAKVKRYKNHE